VKLEGQAGNYYSILRLFVDGSLDDYHDLLANQPTLFSNIASTLSNKAIQHRLQLLTIASLAAETDSKILTYETIRDALQLDSNNNSDNNNNQQSQEDKNGMEQEDNDDENFEGNEKIEALLMDAIHENILAGNMDQMTASFTVTKFVQRSFGTKQWKLLQGKLSDLHDRLTSVLQKFDEFN
jgi:hypothetical protein